jgi:hypothetical protein
MDAYDPASSEMTRTFPYVVRSAERTLPLFNKGEWYSATATLANDAAP